MTTAIKIEHLNKYFGKRKVLDDLCLETFTGEVFGFLGPNGAGKTTTIKLIVGLLAIEEGSISIYGNDIESDFEKALANIGGIVENPEMYKFMTGMQNLKHYANMRKDITTERIEEVVELVGLSNRIHEKVSKYSLGMRQRLGVAQALLHSPKVLILDEPTNGLDPTGIKQLRDILKNVAHNDDVCVFVSSHLMSEMELMCDRVGIVTNGALIDVKTVEDLIKNIEGKTMLYQYSVNDVVLAVNVISELNPDYIVSLIDEKHFSLEIPSDSDDETIASINRALINNNLQLYSVFRKESHNLEDAFIELTKDGGNQIA